MLIYGSVEARVLSNDAETTSYEFIHHYQCDHTEGPQRLQRVVAVNAEDENERYDCLVCEFCGTAVSASRMDPEPPAVPETFQYHVLPPGGGPTRTMIMPPPEGKETR